MTRNELEIHFDYARKMSNDVRDLADRITSDKSDDAINIRKSYENIRKELRYLLQRDYDAENQ